MALIGLNYAAPTEMTEEVKQCRDLEFALDLGPFEPKEVSGILSDLSKLASDGVMQKALTKYCEGKKICARRPTSLQGLRRRIVIRIQRAGARGWSPLRYVRRRSRGPGSCSRSVVPSRQC